MRTYSISEALTNFKKLDDIAYIFKGEMRGTLLYIDRVNDRRFTTRLPNGQYSQALYIGFEPEIGEEGKNIVFYHELVEDAVDNHDEKIVNIILEIQEKMLNVSNDAIKHFNELTPQDQKELIEFLNNQDKGE